MTVAILSLLGALVPFAIWLWKRQAARQDSPVEQHREELKQADRPVTNPTVALSDSLDELERLERLHPPADRKQ